MVWILVVIAIVFVWIFLRFLMDFNKQRSVIASKGGIKTIYKSLIDGLLEYHSARIIQDKKDFITIGGTFTDPIFNRECGLWSVSIQPTFKLLNVRYQAHIDLGGGETDKQMWDFPINMPQDEILSVIKKKADEFDVYGIYK